MRNYRRPLSQICSQGRLLEEVRVQLKHQDIPIVTNLEKGMEWWLVLWESAPGECSSQEVHPWEDLEKMVILAWEGRE